MTKLVTGCNIEINEGDHSGHSISFMPERMTKKRRKRLYIPVKALAIKGREADILILGMSERTVHMDYSKFLGLEPEKRERILNAAIGEFVRSGYEKASTNEIVKEAGISKGSLFKYFHSKKELYMFLNGYVAKVIDKIYEEMDWKERDLFERLRKIGVIKLRIIRTYPEAFHFLYSVSRENAAEVKHEIERTGKLVKGDGLERIFKDIDLSKFRDDIDIPTALQIIVWSMMGFAERERDKISGVADIGMEQFEEWERIADTLKRSFYTTAAVEAGAKEPVGG